MQPPLLVSDIPGLTRVATRLANAWLVDAPGGWVLVDTGGPGYAGRVVHHAERRYGRGTRPHAIVLTHGHVDHAGSAARLARMWRVPVYAHRREIPYLDGRAAYPIVDPDAGGMLGTLTRALPARRSDLLGRLRALPLDGRVPGLPGWRWLRTGGHTPGHVSLVRTSDRLVVAGDALPALAALEPSAVAAGHGAPLSGPGLPAFLRSLADAHAARSAQAGAHQRATAVGLLALGAGLALRTLCRMPVRA